MNGNVLRALCQSFFSGDQACYFGPKNVCYCHKQKGGGAVTRRYYDGPQLTSHHLRDLLPAVLRGIANRVEQQPTAVVEAWPHVIGPELAPLTRAVRFEDGLLTVKVSDSTLYALLSRHERPELLRNLRARFPKTSIKNIVFRIG
jgi:hypothetical protein